MGLEKEDLTGTEEQLLIPEPRIRRFAGGAGWVLHGFCFEFANGSRTGICLEDDKSPMDINSDISSDLHLRRRNMRWVELSEDEIIVEVSGHASLFGYVCFDIVLHTSRGRK